MIRSIALVAALAACVPQASAGEEGVWSQAYRLAGQGTLYLNGQAVGVHDQTIAMVSCFSYDDDPDRPGVRDGAALSIFSRTPGGWLRDRLIIRLDRPRVSTAIPGRVAMTSDRIVACAPTMRTIIALSRNTEGEWVEETGVPLGSTGMREAVFDGERTLVGHGLTGAGVYSGRIEVYNSAWALLGVIEPPDPQNYGRFGSSLALDADTLVIGEPGHLATKDEHNAPSTPGRAHVFVRSGDSFVHHQTLTQPPTPQEGALFGHSVSVSGDTLVVGAPLAKTDDSSNGAAYLYERDDSGMWSLARVLTPADVAAWSPAQFGWSVDLRGDRLAVGGASQDSGVYVFTRGDEGQWAFVSALRPANDTAGGFSLASTDDTIVFGAPGPMFGATYVAPRLPDCFRDLRGDANGDGVTDFADLNLVLGAYGQEGDNLAGDLNHDGVVDFIDVNFVFLTFGSPCLPPS